MSDLPESKPCDCGRYWVLVWMPGGEPIVPTDPNPFAPADGMMVYRSRESAETAASYENELWHENELWGGVRENEDFPATATAIPLSRLGAGERRDG